MKVIYKKELKGYFTSFIGYAFIAFFLIIIGIYFSAYNIMNSYANFEYTLRSVSFIFFILTPVITMRVMAEERHQKTDQLLLTSPVTVEKIVLGKFFATITVFLIGIAVICFYPLIMKAYGNVSLGTAYATIFGFTLEGMAFISLGLFVSTCCENQMVSAVVSFIATIILYFITSLTGMLPSDNKSAFIFITVLLAILWLIIYYIVKNVLLSAAGFGVCEAVAIVLYVAKNGVYDNLVANFGNFLSITDRFTTFTNGIIDLSNIVYMISFTFIFVFLSVQVIKKRRWS